MAITFYGRMKLPEKLALLVKNQSALSRKTGISQSAISEMISEGRRPYFDQMVEIARALGVSLDFLADDEMDEQPVSEFTDDERWVVELVRALRLDRDEVARRLYRVPINHDSIILPPKSGVERKEPGPDHPEERDKKGRKSG